MRRRGPELPSKTERFDTMTQIVMMAFYTGEYRDPGFKEEMSEIIDYVMAEELDEIKRVADNERAMLREEMKMLREEASKKIDDIFDRHMIILQIEIRRIFEQAARDADARIEQSLAALQKTPPEAASGNPRVMAPEAFDKFDRSRRDSDKRMEKFFGQILAGFRMGPS